MPITVTKSILELNINARFRLACTLSSLGYKIAHFATSFLHIIDIFSYQIYEYYY